MVQRLSRPKVVKTNALSLTDRCMQNQGNENQNTFQLHHFFVLRLPLAYRCASGAAAFY